MDFEQNGQSDGFKEWEPIDYKTYRESDGFEEWSTS
jgi:hypothetical protein